MTPKMLNRVISISLSAFIWRVFAFSVLLIFTATGNAWAGSIFLTGHDPDFHALDLGANPAGAMNINNAAIGFVTDSVFNPFTAGGTQKFLFVESKGSAPGGHTNGVNGIVASGYVAGTDFDHHDASTLNGALDELGTTYNAIVVASDFGGILTQAELDILNARSGDIVNFLNAGGGLYAMAESNGGVGLTPNGGYFGFLPFVVSSTAFAQTESGITVTAFGAGLGLTNSDVNGNFSHNIFTATFGLNIVDVDQFGNTLSLAGRGEIGPGGVVPIPAAVWLFSSGLLGLIGFARRKKK